VGQTVVDADGSDAIAELMRKIQKKNFDAHGHYYRGTHVSPSLLPRSLYESHHV